MVGTPGYRHSTNEIFLYLDDGDAEDLAREQAGYRNPIGQLGWHTWKTIIVHEMIHEYQFKCLLGPSAAGIALLSTHGRHFSGPGHDELFYSAIVANAPLFDVTPEQLLTDL
jgi:hypothetical protein